jgi:hypothetical protein
MPSSFEENTEVITLDGKKIGKVKKIENDGYFIVYKKGLLTDEEFRIPLRAVLTRGNISAKDEPIRLNMSEQTLKHGYQFVQAGPNSQFMHGIKESEPKVKLEKQVMHFEPVEPVEEPNKTGISSPPVSKQYQAVLKQGEESSTLYSCDMCPAKFNKAEELQKHRSESHKAAFNI